jgi:hypothetical protein
VPTSSQKKSSAGSPRSAAADAAADPSKRIAGSAQIVKPTPKREISLPDTRPETKRFARFVSA